MSSNGNKRSLAGKILMKLILQCDERIVALFREFDIPQDCTTDVWSYSGCLGFNRKIKQRALEIVDGFTSLWTWTT